MILPNKPCPHCRKVNWSEIPNKPVPCVKCIDCGSEYMKEFIDNWGTRRWNN